MNPSTYKIVGTTDVALTQEHERELLNEYRRSKCVQCRDDLIKAYLLFTVKTARGTYPWLPGDESLQLSHDAILDAIDRMDLGRHPTGRLFNLIPFSVRICFKKKARVDELVHGPSRERSMSRRVSIHGDERTNTAPEVDLDSLLGSADSAADLLSDGERRAALAVAMEALTKDQRVLVTRVFFDGEKMADIGRESRPAVSRQAIHQKCVGALTVLRDELRKSGIFDQ